MTQAAAIICPLVYRPRLSGDSKIIQNCRGKTTRSFPFFFLLFSKFVEKNMKNCKQEFGLVSGFSK
jgi:hypothetical protein